MAVAEGASAYIERRYIEKMVPMVMGLHQGTYSDEEKAKVEIELNLLMNLYMEVSNQKPTRTQIEGLIQDTIYNQLKQQRDADLNAEARHIIDAVFKHAPYTPKVLR
jgi:hypothetical protein